MNHMFVCECCHAPKPGAVTRPDGSYLNFIGGGAGVTHTATAQKRAIYGTDQNGDFIKFSDGVKVWFDDDSAARYTDGQILDDIAKYIGVYRNTAYLSPRRLWYPALAMVYRYLGRISTIRHSWIDKPSEKEADSRLISPMSILQYVMYFAVVQLNVDLVRKYARKEFHVHLVDTLLHAAYSRPDDDDVAKLEEVMRILRDRIIEAGEQNDLREWFSHTPNTRSSYELLSRILNETRETSTD